MIDRIRVRGMLYADTIGGIPEIEAIIKQVWEWEAGPIGMIIVDAITWTTSRELKGSSPFPTTISIPCEKPRIVTYIDTYCGDYIKIVYADGLDWLLEEMEAVRRAG